jgi:hypothetical protein
MTTGLRKDKSIWMLLGDLARRLDSQGYQVVDHWEADLHAIGVAAQGNPDHLVYVCTFGQPPGTVAYECETPGTDVPYVTTGTGNAAGVDELASIIQRHLSTYGTDLAQ